jgi:hypothetical protein
MMRLFESPDIAWFAFEYLEEKLGMKKSKVRKVMHEYKHGELHSGSKSGPKVKSRKQAVAIALSEARRGKKK